MEKTIELIRKQRQALVEAIVAIDSQRWPNKSLEQARDVIDLILNHSDDLKEASEMELTKISLVE
jgi:hypothetical protein